MKDFIRYPDNGSKVPVLVRNERNQIIGRDDVINLKIALEISEDVLDFVHDSYMFNNP
jgi:hypothetical protein